ncbi:MAG: lipoate--protein ligase [Bacteroidetes bacterium]|nr:MAG: lipoate--protein ligase [Bacteroidota bacterium]
MLTIKSPINYPPFNIASEEYLIKNFQENIFLLYINDPTIIVGKHQNTLAEINTAYVQQQGIHVVRRLSGGGAVFHDHGNLNFCFITNQEGDQKVDFRKYTQPIIEVLQHLGINATFQGRNDLTIDGKKFSGNASHVYKNRVLHHGTILFDAKMDQLAKALKTDPLKFSDKAVKSVRSRVTNIVEHLKAPLTIEELEQLIINHINTLYPEATPYSFSKKDKQEIEILVKEKFDTWDWNYGYSPQYTFEKSIKTTGGKIEFHLEIKEGIIAQIKIFGDFFAQKPTEEIERLLTGSPHDLVQLQHTLEGIDFNSYFNNVPLAEFINGMF